MRVGGLGSPAHRGQCILGAVAPPQDFWGLVGFSSADRVQGRNWRRAGGAQPAGPGRCEGSGQVQYKLRQRGQGVTVFHLWLQGPAGAGAPGETRDPAVPGRQWAAVRARADGVPGAKRGRHQQGARLGARRVGDPPASRELPGEGHAGRRRPCLGLRSLLCTVQRATPPHGGARGRGGSQTSLQTPCLCRAPPSRCSSSATPTARPSSPT